MGEGNEAMETELREVKMELTKQREAHEATVLRMRKENMRMKEMLEQERSAYRERETIEVMEVAQSQSNDDEDEKETSPMGSLRGKKQKRRSSRMQMLKGDDAASC